MTDFIMTPAIVELFDLMAEECCEVGVKRSKVRRFGPHEGADYEKEGRTNIEAFKAEVMDVMVLAGLMCDLRIITQDEYDAHTAVKLARLHQYAPSIFEENE